MSNTTTCESCKRPPVEGVELVPTKIGTLCEICLDLIEAERALLAVLRK